MSLARVLCSRSELLQFFFIPVKLASFDNAPDDILLANRVMNLAPARKKIEQLSAEATFRKPARTAKMLPLLAG